MKRVNVILALLLATIAARADEVPDDVGDTAAEAQTISGTGTFTRVIEWDADYDWYAFSAKPWIDYSVTVSTGTINDCEVSLVSPAGYGVLKYTNTAAGSAAQVTYGSTTVAVRVFLKVIGLAEFTTGTYNVALGQTLADTNTNGLPDAWETNYFGNLTNSASGDNDHDGFDNMSEYLSGTSPNNASSLLKFTRIARVTNATVITWQTVSNGSYRVSSAIYPGAGWVVQAPAALAITTNASLTNASTTATSSTYKVDLVY